MKCKNLFFVCCVLVGMVGVAQAESRDEFKLIKSALNSLRPGIAADSIRPTSIDGLYEVALGTDIYYMTGDGRYLIQGDMLEISSKINLTEPRRDALRAKVIDAVGEENMIVFSPKKTEHTITVFTDIDCGYCRKLHKEVEQFNEYGIKVRYLFYPRTGPNTASFDKAVTVWCSDDRNQALTDSKAGKILAKRQCDNPVRDHFETGQSLALRGTPAIVLEDGKMLPGYVSAKRIAAMYGAKLAVRQK